MKELDRIIENIKVPDRKAEQAALNRMDQLTKPRGSLARLEELAVKIAGIQRKVMPIITNKAIITMAADHGVVAEGVSLYPQDVTVQMVANFLAGGAGVNVLSRHAGARVVIVDMGVAGRLPQNQDLLRKPVGPGTKSIMQGAAMSGKEAQKALSNGIEVLEDVAEEGLDIVGLGEMGIGNTTAASAVASALCGRPASELTGRGTGLDDEGLRHKIEVVEKSLSVNQPNPKDGLDVLKKVGGFEIGGMAGAMLAAAARGIPIVLDGFICTAAAMIASSLAPKIGSYFIASHKSAEDGHSIMLDYLGLKPYLDLGFRLGEGTGAALGISLAEASVRVLSEMATFAEAGVSDKDGIGG